MPELNIAEYNATQNTPLRVMSFLNGPLKYFDFDFSYSRYDVANLVVYLGAHNIKTNEGERTSHKVIRLIKHKGFDQGTLVSCFFDGK